jgi:tetratricopeptide (TPR) repeat protein
MLFSEFNTVAASTDPRYVPTHDWFNLLERLSERQISTQVAIDQAKTALASTADQRWVVPLAMALWIENRHSEALNHLLNPIAVERCDSLWMYHNLVGMVARKVEGENQRAIAAYSRSLELDPNRADTLYNYANLLKEEQPENAIQLYRKSLTLKPYADASWHNYGTALNAIHEYHQAKNALRISIKLDPKVADVWCNLGLAYFGADEFDSAERCFRFAISLNSNHSASHTNLGNALISILQPEEALHYLERGVELDQSSTHSLWNLSLAYLLLGQYAKGWPYYEVRFENEDFEQVVIPTVGPWLRCLSDAPRLGDPPLVVWSEQGLGDAIQFCRYLYLLEAAGIPFVFLARPSLIQLMQEWTEFKQFVQPLKNLQNKQDTRPHVALMSLPNLFNTELHTIPCSVPYLRTSSLPPEELKITPPPGGISVGLVWATNPDNKPMYRNKSLPLAILMPLVLRLIDLDLIELHSLQFGDDSEQLNPWINIEEIHDWKDRITNFSDTAHLVRQLDLIISVDTAVAHLAGALNKPTWLLLPQNSDFRWMRKRIDSPWYPSMRLFRQTNHGDWQSVVSQLDQAFDTMLLVNSKNLLAARNT